MVDTLIWETKRKISASEAVKQRSRYGPICAISYKYGEVEIGLTM